jgi:hypothetical protein
MKQNLKRSDRISLISLKIDQTYLIHRDHCPAKCLGTIGRDPSGSKTHRLHVDIFQVFLLN